MRKWFLGVSLLALFLVLPIVIFYAHYQRIALNLMQREHISSSAANGYKHAYAAAQLYLLTRAISTDEEATALVLSLGKFNEYFEQVTRRRDPDSTEEIAKDLHNNYVGLLTARWLKNQPATVQSTGIHMPLMRLLRAGVILNSYTEVHFPDGVNAPQRPRDVRYAIDWFGREHTSIKHHTEAALAR